MRDYPQSIDECPRGMRYYAISETLTGEQIAPPDTQSSCHLGDIRANVAHLFRIPRGHSSMLCGESTVARWRDAGQDLPVPANFTASVRRQVAGFRCQCVGYRPRPADGCGTTRRSCIPPTCNGAFVFVAVVVEGTEAASVVGVARYLTKTGYRISSRPTSSFWRLRPGSRGSVDRHAPCRTFSVAKLAD
jgi:hypothetical protein